MEYEILTRSLKDSAAHSKLKLLKEGETFGVEKPGGEKRIHIGSMTDENKWDSFFFPNGGQSFNVIVSKIDLIKYMFEAKDEYFNPKQSYRLKISDYYDSLYEQTLNIPLESFKICFEKNTDNSRFYLTRPSNNEFSKNYKYIIDICLPIVTKYVFIRVKDDNSYIFYLKPEFRPNYITNEIITPDVTEKDIDSKYPLQQIYYGAPGTGKSHRVNEVTEAQPEENVFRTTFHPDSDYSTFVGCYKPTKEPSLQKQPILDYDSLVDKLKEYLAIQPVNITRSCALFGYDYHDSIVKMQDGGGHTIPSLVADAYKSGTSYDSTVRAGMSIYESGAKTQNTSSTITYTFVPQAFTKAYIRAGQSDEPVYLVIEEINRGNCAQIFGDLFQLLDRKNGESEYPIKPDTDLGNFIAEKLSSHVDGAPEKVVNGELMILPKNLYIWATMNTSDQSLFPIDSAFKRRWDWKYIPINYHKEQWFIEADNAKYSWSAFLETINDIINEKTSSEDKQLGFYFCKAKDNIIDAETFVSKVVFYLWNDVFKDYGFDGEYFQDPDGGTLEFRKFFNFDGTINEKKVTAFMKNLNLNSDVEGEDNTDSENQGNDRMKVSFPDNTIFDDEKPIDVFKKTIDKIVKEHGLDAVKNAEIKFSGLNIIQDEGWQTDKYGKSSQKQMDGYVLFINADNPTKKSALEKLSERLSLGLIVEFVS